MTLPERQRKSLAQAVEIDSKLAFEIAQGLEEPASIAERYGVTPAQWIALSTHKPFLRLVASYVAQLKKDGYTFKVKAQLQAEELLLTAYTMAQSPDTPAAVRADLIKWSAKVAGLEPSEKGPAVNSGGFQVNINLGDAGKTVTIDGRALPPPA